MLNPVYKRYADRLRALIDEGKSVTELEQRHGSTKFDVWIGKEDKIPLHAWLGKVNNVLYMVFGPESPQVKHFTEILPHENLRSVERAHEVYYIIGVLEGALDDLEHGFLTGQEFLVAGEVFDSVLEQAKHLVDTGYKDPAAVLARVVLEDALKRIARAEGLDDTLKASRINDELKKAQRYPQPQWRLVQAWLDVGNSAAHGRFDDYDAERVQETIRDIEHFLATELRI